MTQSARDVIASIKSWGENRSKTGIELHPIGFEWADAIIAALTAAGYKITAREPTEAMIEAARVACPDPEVSDYLLTTKDWEDILRAALDAAE